MAQKTQMELTKERIKDLEWSEDYHTSKLENVELELKLMREYLLRLEKE